jgi:integrase
MAMAKGNERDDERRNIGHVEYVEAKAGELGHYRVRLRLADGTRPYVHLAPSPRSRQAEKRARRKAEAWMERVRAEGTVRAAAPPPAETETTRAWWARYLDHRTAKGQQSVRDARGRLENWILPALADTPMSKVTPEALENLVAVLDDAVEQERISWKTAKNIWGEVTAAFNQACRSKRRDLRVRQDNPTANVPGPDRGQQRQQPILYPDEVVRLLSCEKVPIHWRVLYAVAIYTGGRAGELAALSASDVDLRHRRLTIARQRDRQTGELRLTKTKVTRSFDIEDALHSLLEKLVGARPNGELLRLPADEHRAKLLRQHLEAAGVRRAELFVEGDPTRSRFTFHGLRHTHLTWMAVRGDDAVKIQMRAGHTDFKMTQRYIEAARTLGAGFGRAFPALPAEMIEGALGGREGRALNADESAKLKEWAARHADLPLRALRARVIAEMGKTVGISTIWRELRGAAGTAGD